MEKHTNNKDAKEKQLAKVPLFGVSYDARPVKEVAHQHPQAQLMYCSAGVAELIVADKIFLLPPTHAVWVPSHIPHALLSEKKLSFRSLYFDTTQLLDLPQHVQILAISPLLRELILSACDFSLDYKIPGKESRLTAVIIDQLKVAEQQAFSLQVTNHPLIQSIYHFIMQHLAEPLTISEVAKKFAMSSKSLNRLFHKQLGMTFQQWRTQLKILRAISMLSQGASTSQLSQALGYSGDSAFIHQFKRATGKTPKAFRHTAISCS